MAINRHKFEASLPTTDSRVKAFEDLIDKHIKANWTRYTKSIGISLNDWVPLYIQQAVKEVYFRNGWKITFESSYRYNEASYSIRVEGC